MEKAFPMGPSDLVSWKVVKIQSVNQFAPGLHNLTVLLKR